MFSLVSGFWEYCFSRPTLHILLIGLDHAGKTTILERIKSQFGKSNSIPPHRIQPTVGMNLGKIQYNGAEVIFWDLGGQKRMHGLWEKYYNEANAVIFVIDSADPNRFAEARAVLSNAVKCEGLSTVPVLLFANKQDIPGSSSPDELVASFSAALDGSIQASSISGTPSKSKSSSTLYAGGRKIIYGVSGITGEGLADGIDAIIADAKEHAYASANPEQLSNV